MLHYDSRKPSYVEHILLVNVLFKVLANLSFKWRFTIEPYFVFNSFNTIKTNYIQYLLLSATLKYAIDYIATMRCEINTVKCRIPK